MVSSTDMLSAIREMTNTKQLDRAELHGLLQDGIFAALAKKYGPTVQAEVEIDEERAQRWDRASVHEFSGTYGDYLLAKVSKVFPALRERVL